MEASAGCLRGRITVKHSKVLGAHQWSGDLPWAGLKMKEAGLERANT